MNLRWNTSEYGGVKDLRIPPHRLWKPGMSVSMSITFHVNYMQILEKFLALNRHFHLGN